MKQNFIELITVPFNAGESKLFAISGQYFELIDATNPVDVLLSDVNGAQRGVMRSAEASFNLKDTDFATVQLYSATAQTIRFAYGTGEAGTRRAAGAVSIVGTVPVTVGNAIALDAPTLVTMGRPELPALFSTQNAVLAANTAVNIFTAAANVNGAILWSASAADQMGGAAILSLIAKATAPANTADGEIIALAQATPISTVNYMYMQKEVPTRIAPGQGLWWVASLGGTSSSCMRTARYTLL